MQDVVTKASREWRVIRLVAQKELATAKLTEAERASGSPPKDPEKFLFAGSIDLIMILFAAVLGDQLTGKSTASCGRTCFGGTR